MKYLSIIKLILCGAMCFFAAPLQATEIQATSAQAEPIQADPAFDGWVRSLLPVAKANGIKEEVFERAFEGITPDPTVLAAANNQAEFVKAIWDYLDRAVSDTRVANGKIKHEEFTADLALMEEKWGVDQSVLVAIWGLESAYGDILDNPKIVKSVIRSLATLAYQGGKRAKFGRTQLIAALKILQNADTTLDRLTGSWAGAMGHTQFIPTTYLAHAVDYDGDGKRDVWGLPHDALASAANYLAVSGWQRGKGWGVEVTLPSEFDYDLADGKIKKSTEEWLNIGITLNLGNNISMSDMARLFLPGGASGPAFLLFKNFDVIKRYNNADAYALAIGHLSDRIEGATPFQARWPRHLKPLTHDQTKEVQRLLTQKGFSTGGVDGILGPKSRAAVRAYQKAIGKIPDGFVTTLLLEELQS
ncbi:MAG: lytic murein transglycosylase [Hyphomicrobiales bacterium]